MFTTLYVRLKYWFYPIGNTPAVDLLRDTCLTQSQPAEILSLGCGDPRSILYTVWNHTNPFRFTCCDIEPAILARNVLLFATLIRNRGNDSQKLLWNIFYHVYITRKEADLITHMLYELLESFKTLQEWHSSDYGCAIRFLDTDTFCSIRRIWQRYYEQLVQTTEDRRAYELKVRSQFRAVYDKHVGDNLVLTGLRSAGARAVSAAEAVTISFRQFWLTGVAAGNSEDVANLEGGGTVNPLLAISSPASDDFALHYGTDPLLGFHLAKAFDLEDKDLIVQNMVLIAKHQFDAWCSAFRQATQCQRVTCLYHCGDAISFGHKLQSPLDQRVFMFTSPWNMRELDLISSELKTQILFDVIDTSNLVDHLGLLNILPAVIPLLKHSPTSVLYTESLLRAATNTSKALETMLASDPSTAFLLFQLAPVSCLTGTSTDMSCNQDTLGEILQGQTGRQRQSLVRLTWKSPAFGDFCTLSNRFETKHKIECDAESLASYFYDVYLKLFSREDFGQIGELFARQVATPLAADVLEYSRTTVVLLISLVKKTIQSDWRQCMEYFIRKVTGSGELPIGLNYIQEFLMWLHIYGIYDTEFFYAPFEDCHFVKTASSKARSRLPILFDCKSPPKVVYLTIIIPRRNLSVLTGGSPDKTGTPGLHVEVTNFKRGLSNSFLSINGVFGQLESNKSEAYTSTVVEDTLGWYGTSNLIVVCAVPALALLIGDPDEILVSLGLNSSLSTTHFVKKLGIRLKLFETRFDKQDQVQVLIRPPGFRKREGSSPCAELAVLNVKEDSICSLQFELEHMVKMLRQHVPFPEGSAQAELLTSGAMVTISRNSPCSVNLHIGRHSQTVLFPYPVHGAATKTRVSRKNSWIEVVAPLSSALQMGGYNPERFPTLMVGRDVFQWGLSLVNLDTLPSISPSADSKWISTLIGMSLSARERRMNKALLGGKESSVQLKESIHAMFESFTGQNPSHHGHPIKAFRLTLETGDCDTIIIANEMYYDATSSSIVMDAHVVCLSHSRMRVMRGALQKLPHSAMLSINISEAEEQLWKHLIPALVERCRNEQWEHRNDCEYRSLGKIPLSNQHGFSPVCICGEGKSLKTYNHHPGFVACSKFASRIALAPLAAPPYVDEITEKDTIQPLRATLDAHCGSCGNQSDTLKSCARCHQVKYCNQECQKAAWKRHKAWCGK